jgi:hypothetical protein
VWEIEDLQGTSRPWDSSSWRREASGLPHDLHHQQRRQGAVGELDLRSVEAFLKF